MKFQIEQICDLEKNEDGEWEIVGWKKAKPDINAVQVAERIIKKEDFNPKLLEDEIERKFEIEINSIEELIDLAKRHHDETAGGGDLIIDASEEIPKIIIYNGYLE
jgi:hypothetical protein